MPGVKAEYFAVSVGSLHLVEAEIVYIFFCLLAGSNLKILQSDWDRERQNCPISDHDYGNNTHAGEKLEVK